VSTISQTPCQLPLLNFWKTRPGAMQDRDSNPGSWRSTKNGIKNVAMIRVVRVFACLSVAYAQFSPLLLRNTRVGENSRGRRSHRCAGRPRFRKSSDGVRGWEGDGGGGRVGRHGGKCGPASAASSNRVDNLQAALERHDSGIGWVYGMCTHTYTCVCVRRSAHTGRAVRGFSCCYFLAGK